MSKKLAALKAQMEALQRAQEEALNERAGEVAEVAKKLDVLEYSDEAIAGALSVLKGLKGPKLAEIEAKGQAALRPGRGRKRNASEGGGDADGDAGEGFPGRGLFRGSDASNAFVPGTVLPGGDEAAADA